MTDQSPEDIQEEIHELLAQNNCTTLDALKILAFLAARVINEMTLSPGEARKYINEIFLQGTIIAYNHIRFSQGGPKPGPTIN